MTRDGLVNELFAHLEQHLISIGYSNEKDPRLFESILVSKEAFIEQLKSSACNFGNQPDFRFVPMIMLLGDKDFKTYLENLKFKRKAR